MILAGLEQADMPPLWMLSPIAAVLLLTLLSNMINAGFGLAAKITTNVR